VTGPNKELGKLYVNFVRCNLEQLRQKISDELWVLQLLEVWYSAQVQLLCNWLLDRIDHALHHVQLTSLVMLIKVNISPFPKWLARLPLIKIPP
jgi:hypothetical protein